LGDYVTLAVLSVESFALKAAQAFLEVGDHALGVGPHFVLEVEDFFREGVPVLVAEEGLLEGFYVILFALLLLLLADDLSGEQRNETEFSLGVRASYHSELPVVAEEDVLAVAARLEAVVDDPG